MRVPQWVQNTVGSRLKLPQYLHTIMVSPALVGVSNQISSPVFRISSRTIKAIQPNRGCLVAISQGSPHKISDRSCRTRKPKPNKQTSQHQISTDLQLRTHQRSRTASANL